MHELDTSSETAELNHAERVHNYNGNSHGFPCFCQKAPLDLAKLLAPLVSRAAGERERENLRVDLGGSCRTLVCGTSATRRPCG